MSAQTLVCTYGCTNDICQYACMHVCMYLCLCVFVFVSLYHCARQAVWRGGRALCVCVCVCVWSRCAWPPCAACCPSVLPSVCRLRPRSANSTTPQRERPRREGCWETEGRDGKKSERWMEGRKEEEEGERMGASGRGWREEGEGDYKAGSMEDGNGSKRKWERGKGRWVMGRESMHELAGNGRRGWSGEGGLLSGGHVAGMMPIQPPLLIYPVHSFPLFFPLSIHSLILTPPSPQCRLLWTCVTQPHSIMCLLHWVETQQWVTRGLQLGR